MVPGTKEIELGDIYGEEKDAAAKTNQAEITIDQKTEKDASVVQQAVVIVDEKKEENAIIVKQAEVTVDEKKEENTVVVMQFEITVHEKKEEDATELEATYGEIEELEAQVPSLKKDLVKGHEGKQSPNDKGGLGFNSNNKNKSTTHKWKKGHGHVKDPAKIVCFKCKIEGHHFRLCPLKKKPLGEKKQGKRPQDGAQGLPRHEERPLPKKDQAKAPVVEKSSEKKEKRRTCYTCREKGHISSFCTIGNSSNPILIDGAYSLCKDKVGNVFAKYMGTQCGFSKRTIWVAKPIVTKFLGPNLVGDHQAKI
ncbi:hypothetical protein QYE76_058282 [Lolium multiflorum]|uniref:CCHC-type domain-containing protein n=1 Tax=Lolium multiflorum TaxID=4521 RepID=A0AAD8T577_LOLMU|nr:hypothetical protein QYE76_058282 [Lolium multiflorum]